jgi:hypothetical protein
MGILFVVWLANLVGRSFTGLVNLGLRDLVEAHERRQQTQSQKSPTKCLKVGDNQS